VWNSAITEVYILAVLYQTIAAINCGIQYRYLCSVYVSLSVSRNTAYEIAAYSQKRLPTCPFLAECFCISAF